jgi:hypothetical protein
MSKYPGRSKDIRTPRVQQVKPKTSPILKNPFHSWMAVVRPILNDAEFLFPGINLASKRAHEELKDTLFRVARHMRERIGQYQAFYIQFQETIKPRFNQDISEHEKILKEALHAVKNLPKHPVEPAIVHDALRKVSAAAHAIIFLQQTEIELLKLELAKRDDQLTKTSVSPVGSESHTKPVLKLSPAEIQVLRNQVREMALSGKPMEGIPLYRGLRRGDKDAVSFFKEHYASYVVPGQEVIFASDLSNFDQKLMTAFRNQCRDGVAMPLGTQSDKVSAIIEGRFFDGAMAARSARYAGVRQAVAKKNQQVAIV